MRVEEADSPDATKLDRLGGMTPLSPVNGDVRVGRLVVSGLEAVHSGVLGEEEFRWKSEKPVPPLSTAPGGQR